MQLYALDNTVPIIATDAKKEKSYLCPECNSLLKVRSGPSRQPHFYHLRKSNNCRQNGKSEEHILLQLRLLNLIGKGAQMEAQFPLIQRIADVAWHEKNLIFEIQCSPISLKEAEERCLDYRQVGYEVMWILHDKRFNQKNLSAAELYLRQAGCYFTNMNKIGQGEIYDQFEVIQNHRRLFKGPKLIAHPTQILPIPQINSPDIALPEIALERLLKWKYFAKGDLLSRLINHCKEAEHLASIEKRLRSPKKKEPGRHLPLFTLLKKGYLALLNLTLSHH